MPRTAEMPRALPRVAPREQTPARPDVRQPDAREKGRPAGRGPSEYQRLPEFIAAPTLPEGHRACPSPQDPLNVPLTRQVVSEHSCAGRQDEGYHKCASCEHFAGSSFAGMQLRPENGPGTLERSTEA